jgi:opacity protein-like surface antigen
MMFIATLAVALAAGVARPALAADLDCQVGMSIGGVFGRSQHVNSNRGAFTNTFDVNGRGVAAQFGCLRARDRVTFGAALDYTSTKAKGNTQELPPNQDIFAETSFDWFATMRGIGGYQVDPRIMVYLTGGVAFSGVNIRVCTVSGPSAGTCGVTSENVWGLVGGVGSQFRISRRWSLHAEYLVFAFENREFQRPGPFNDRGGGVRPEAQIVRAGLNFHF